MAISGLGVVTFAPATTATEVISEVMQENARTMAYSLDDAIGRANALGDAAKDFADGLANPNDTDFWGNTVVDSGLQDSGAYGLAYQAAFTGTVADAASAPALALGDIDTSMGGIAEPIFSDLNIGIDWNEAALDYTLINAVQAKLINDLANGGYGIEPTDEQALWNRMRERELQNGEYLIQDAARQAAARGFTMPAGAMFQQMHIARQDAAEKNSSASRDIAMKRADLYVANRQFTITKAIETENAIVAYVSAFVGRKLEVAKANLDAYRNSIALYESAVQAFVAKVGAKETEIKTKVMAADLKVRKYIADTGAYEAKLRDQIQRAEFAVSKYNATTANNNSFNTGAAQQQTVKVETAKARIQERQLAIQNTTEMNKVKLGAMENTAKLFLGPASELASIANAYISSNTTIAAAIE
jgi:hypothetical protein